MCYGTRGHGTPMRLGPEKKKTCRALSSGNRQNSRDVTSKTQLLWQCVHESAVAHFRWGNSSKNSPPPPPGSPLMGADINRFPAFWLPTGGVDQRLHLREQLAGLRSQTIPGLPGLVCFLEGGGRWRALGGAPPGIETRWTSFKNPRIVDVNFSCRDQN